MTPKQTVEEIANEVDRLVMDTAMRARFTDKIMRLCEMAEKYAEHVQQCLSDPELRVPTEIYEEMTRLQKEINSLYDQRDTATEKGDRKAVAQIAKGIKKKEKRQAILQTKIDTPPVPGCEYFSVMVGVKQWQYFKLNDSEKWTYQHPQWITPDKVNPLAWFREIPFTIGRPPATDEEKLMYEYFVLAVIHDYKYRELDFKPIFPKAYEGTRFYRDIFVDAVWCYYRDIDSDEKQTALIEAFNDVDGDLKRNRLLLDKLQENPTTTQGGKEQTTSETANVKIQPARDQVFISYSHEDKQWLNDLQTHLAPFVRNRTVTAWSDEQIAPGSKWLPAIKAALAATKVAVLLVTKDFLASEFIHEHELTPLLKDAEKGNVRIIWIPVGACSYKQTPLKDYEAVIDPEKPLANMRKADRDKAWVIICEKIKEAVGR